MLILNVFQIGIIVVALGTFGAAAGFMLAGVSTILPFLFVGELVLFGLVTHISKKRTARPVTRPTVHQASTVNYTAAIARQTRIQAQAQVRATRTKVPVKAQTHKAENAFWKWVKEAFGQTVEAARPAVKGAMHEAGNAARLAGRELAHGAGKAGSVLADKAKAGTLTLWNKAWGWVGTLISSLIGKLIKLATGGYGALAMLGFLAATALVLNYAFHFTGQPLEEDEEVWARGLSLTYVLLMLAFVVAGIVAAGKALDKSKVLKEWFK